MGALPPNPQGIWSNLGLVQTKRKSPERIKSKGAFLSLPTLHGHRLLSLYRGNIMGLFFRAVKPRTDNLVTKLWSESTIYCGGVELEL